MLNFVVPLFLVILCGYLFGLKQGTTAATNKTINDFVFWVALPALLFQAVARARPDELANGRFMTAVLIGILVAFVASWAWSALIGRSGSRTAAIHAMAGAYGTSGYMGVPLLIALYGAQATVPAAIATVLHNIPVIMIMVVALQLASPGGADRPTGAAGSLWGAVLVTLKNPLLIAVLAGAAFSLLKLPVPLAIDQFTRFLGGAAGPTALFALGLGLSRFRIATLATRAAVLRLLPLLALKLALMPAATYLALRVLGLSDPSDLLFRTAMVMAALPTGAGVYVFAARYQLDEEEISLLIVVSLCVSIVTLTGLLIALA